jgi:hypothetical protein
MSIKDKTLLGLTNVEAFVADTIEGFVYELEGDPDFDKDVTRWLNIQDELRETLTNARTLVSCVTAH